MVFIVEMAWGRPNEVVVYGMNKDRELVRSHVLEDPDPDPEWRFFSCHRDVWYGALDLGRVWGWQPRGTMPESYYPDGSYEQLFQAEDAAALADALQRFLDSGDGGTVSAQPMTTLLREGMTRKEYLDANRPLSHGFLRNFITFLRKGQFKFFWDD